MTRGQAISIVAGVTLREAARRKLLWMALLAAGLLLAFFAIALRLQVLEFAGRPMSPFVRYQVESGMLMIGLYICSLLAVVMTILTSIDTIAGEISSGTIHAVAAKPLARWQILVGKFAGFVAMITVYVALTFASTVAVAYSITGVLPEHPLRGFTLIVAECMVVLTVTFFLGTGFSQSAHIVSLGVVSSLIMPTESLWRRAAFEMQTPLAGSLSFSPFANVSIPSVAALVYAAVFAVCVGVGALWRMSERDL